MSKERRFIIWEESGVVSFGELVDDNTNQPPYKVINPCIIMCNREEQEYTDPNDGLTKKKHVMQTQFVPYTYDAIFDQDKAPMWTISPTASVLQANTKFRPELIDLYDGTIHSTSAKKAN